MAAGSLALGLGLMLLVAGAQKVASPGDFGRLLEEQGVLPSAVVPAVRVALPACEAMLGLWLWSLYALPAAFAALCVVLLAFLAYRVAVLRSRAHSDCGCFGVAGDGHSPGVQVGAGVIYLLAALAGALAARSAAPVSFGVHLAACSAGAAVGVVLLRGAIRVLRRTQVIQEQLEPVAE